MVRLRHDLPTLVLLCLARLCAGCGGASSPAAPPPPAPDFSIAFSVNSVSVAQGATSVAVNLSINPLNGFTGNVQVILSGVPSGVTTNPAGPFNITAGASASVLFGASANAATGNFTVSAQGSSQQLSHSVNIALIVQSGVASTLPRTSFARTDSTFAADNPSGEPFHRHLAYDSANKHLFVANRAMNRVEIYSTSDQTRIAQISVPGASSADLSSDGATVWIGTSLEHIVAIDNTTLRLKARKLLAGLTPLPATIFNRPVEVLALSSGKCLVRLRQPVSAEALLALWDPAANSLTDLTPTAPSVFQQGVGALARTGDHSRVLAAANDSSGNVAIYDATASVMAGPSSLGTGTVSRASANLDGTRFAVALISGTNTQLFLLDGALQKIATYAPGALHGMAFSRDGKFLYVSESSSAESVVTVLDGHTAALMGQVPDASLQGVSSGIEEADETQLLFGISNRGVSFLDASTSGSLPAQAPVLGAAPSLQPSDGPLTGGTSVILTGQNFTVPTQIKFGAQSAAGFNVPSPAQIQATSPPSVISGPVNVTAFFSNGWLALAPDAFSYGPQILQILPNTGVSKGGDSISIYGYGFGSDATKIVVNIGGANASVQKIEGLSTIASSLGLDSTYPFPVQRLTVTTPPGNAGKADVNVTSDSGSINLPKSFQYLQSANSFSKPGLYKFLFYDRLRQRIYLSGIDHVDVFDLSAGIYIAPIRPPGGPPPNAGLRALALTPSGAQLIVADFGAQNIYLLDPVSGAGTIVSVGGVPGFTNSGPARVAATSTQTVFVGLAGEGGSLGACSACLGQLDLTASPPTLQPAPQPQVKSLTGAPLLHGSAAGDQVFLAFGSSPGGPVASWNANSPNQFTTSSAQALASDLGTASDGTAFALQTNSATEFRASDLSLTAVPASAELAQISGRVFVPGLVLHPSGALTYQPFLSGAPGSPGVKGGVDILDAHSGVLRLRLFLPQQFMTDVDGLHGSFLVTDEDGQRLFALTSSDGTPQNAALTIVQLSAVPLGIGTVSPVTVSAAGGATLTIRGSGFVSGISASINGKSATVTFKDVNSISLATPVLSAGPQQLTLTNPDGESVSLDTAFAAN